jgi:lantibiotic modifying enzyme
MVEFARGLRLIYKPRSTNREKLWFDALRWLNRQQCGVSFRIPKLLPRSRYLWMEFLPTKSCRSMTEVRRFYFRWGAQTALAQILGAIDLHRDNWLAIGSQPILVDLESVYHAPERGKKTLDRQSLSALLETGLFPLISRDRAGSYRGIAPFDARSLEQGPANCWPRYRRAIQPPSKFVSELVRGFEAVAEIFADTLLAKNFFKEVLARSGKNGTDRILPRATAQYALLLRESFEPRNMISAGARWRALKQQCSLSAMNRRIGLAEARALLRCDIPRFTTRRRNPFVSWKRFLAAVAELKRSPRRLRSRVLIGVRVRRD